MKKNKGKNTELEKKIEQALRTGGFVLPKYKNEVNEFERIYGSTDVILPEELQNPTFLIISKNKPTSSKVKHLPNTNFAMAARDGAKDLPEEIKNQMEKDRRKVDSKKDNDKR